ncbi:hypothetical protein, partial [Proteus terrae]|uniref:hypothetical protein n=1 Tax=Proteus terrae TaxID=1574161 RepID=UPI001E2D0CA1
LKLLKISSNIFFNYNDDSFFHIINLYITSQIMLKIAFHKQEMITLIYLISAYFHYPFSNPSFVINF